MQANPAVIVVARMDRRRFPADDLAVKMNFLQTDPVVSHLPARAGEAHRGDGRAIDEPNYSHDRWDRGLGQWYQGVRPQAVTPVWAGGGGWAARAGALLAALAALMLAIGFAVSVGEIRIPLATTAKAVSNRLLGTGYPLSRIQEGIIWDYRMSRALLAACCGGGLAVSGTVLQALLRNPLAEPYILGISAGASTGAVMVVILGLGGGLVSPVWRRVRWRRAGAGPGGDDRRRGRRRLRSHHPGRGGGGPNCSTR